MFDKFTLQNLANKSGGVLYFLYIASEVNNTMRRWFYHTDFGQNAVFTILQDKLQSFSTIETRTSFAQQIIELTTL